MGASLIYQITERMAAVRSQIESHLVEIEARQNEQNRITDAVAERGDDNLSPQESARYRELTDQVQQLDRELNASTADGDAEPGLREQLAELEERHAELSKNAEIQERTKKVAEEWATRGTGTPNPQPGSGIRVKAEPRTYNPDAERQGVSFFRDVYRRWKDGDSGATERLQRHEREARLNEASVYEKRDGTTANFTGLTVPQYLTDLVAPDPKAMAPTVALCNRHPLPADGMTVNISRITTGSSVAAQSDQGDAVSETDVDDTLLTVNVRTYAGQQVLSRQAIERGTGVDTIVANDLVRSYWTTLDDGILNGAGTNGTHTGLANTSSIVSVAYADTSPTVAELYPKLADLIQQVQTGVYMGVSHFIMHPRRAWWLAKELSSTFPLMTVPGAGFQQAGTVGSTEYSSMGHSILGVPIVLDGNVTTTDGGSTNEDVIYGVTANELHLWHDNGPLFIRAEQPQVAGLEVQFVVYSYSAFTAGRYPGAHGTISSTGLSTPSF